jgi:hypothetical protein
MLIADSKKAYSRAAGIKHLERTVLGCLKCLGKEPATLTELMELLCPECLERLSAYPWYSDAGNHSLTEGADDRSIAAAVLADDLVSKGIELLDMRSYCLDVGYYNKMVDSVKNKAHVLFCVTCRLIKRAYDEFDGDELQIIIDRQGGRVHYRQHLQRMFGDMELKILCESPSVSSYEMRAGGKVMRVHFVVGADESFLPVSLASMVSKYLRELLVYNMNRYFTGFHSGLRPTAGYWKDGLRFLEDLKANIPGLQVDMERLVRCR